MLGHTPPKGKEKRGHVSSTDSEDLLLVREPLFQDGPRTEQQTRRRPGLRAYRGAIQNSFAFDSERSRDSIFEEKKEEEEEETPDSPKWAIFYFVLYTIFSTYNLIAGKFFRTWYPEMSTFQLLFYRGFSACLVMMMYMGRDAKHQLIDKVSVDNFPPLAFRIFQGIFSQFIRYYSMTFFSLSMIGVIQKLAPVFTVVLAYAILSEQLTGLEILLNVIAVLAGILVTVGDHNQNGHQYSSNHYTALVFLVLNPVLIGMSAIALRKMKKTSVETLTTWTNITQSVFMATSMMALNQSFFDYPMLFSVTDWIMLFGMTLSVIGAQTFKLKAFQNQAASKLQVLGNLQMVYQFLFDVFLFNTLFSELQYWGIGVTVLTFILDIYLTIRSGQNEVSAEITPALLDTVTISSRSLTSSTLTHENPAETEMPVIMATADGPYQRKGPSSMISSKRSIESNGFVNDGTSGATKESRKMKHGSLTSEDGMLDRNQTPPHRSQFMSHQNISGKYKGQVYKFDDQD